MRQALDDAFEQVAQELPTLLAMVLSIDPDATITWAWSSDHEPRRALGFAALHRAATMCLDGLDGQQQLQRLLLTSNLSWITSQPLHSPNDRLARAGRPHFVVTTAFCGDIRAGAAVVQTARLRDRIKAIVDAHAEPRLVVLRDGLVELLTVHDDPLACLASLSEDTGIEVTDLGRLDRLSPQHQLSLTAWLHPQLAAL